MTLQLSSPVLKEGELIPTQYTKDGKDRSPPLAWEAPPKGTVSFALICDDPDAPGGTWVHWLLYDLPGDARELKEGLPTDQKLDNGARQGKNSFGDIGYGGPQPPAGKGAHRYYFKLYALDTMLSELPAGATKDRLESAMKGHIIAQGQLMGKYQR